VRTPHIAGVGEIEESGLEKSLKSRLGPPHKEAHRNGDNDYSHDQLNPICGCHSVLPPVSQFHWLILCQPAVIPSGSLALLGWENRLRPGIDVFSSPQSIGNGADDFAVPATSARTTRDMAPPLQTVI
jgi:hypothetical protein